MSITNKNRMSLLYLLINYISAKSTPHMFSLKDEYTLCLLNFVIIGLCNYSAHCWFNIISLSTAPPADFLSKNCKSLKQNLFGIHHI